MVQRPTGPRRTRLLQTSLAILAGAFVLWSPGLVAFWLFGDEPFHRAVMAIAYLYYAASGLLAWTVFARLDGALQARPGVSVGVRVTLGALAIALGNVGVYAVLYELAFPFFVGRAVHAGAFYSWWLHVTVVAVVIYGWLVVQRAMRAEAVQLVDAQLETDLLATAVDGAELALLEAQIEPHFLFNTLAHVKRQYGEAGRGGDESHRLSDALVDYLERASPALRRSDWTVGDELDLVAIYLDILGQRFEGRLAATIEADAAARRVVLPALTIATLVENAIRHGLSPKTAAGHVRVRVDARDTHVAITVRDDGVGLGQSSGTGLGLATVRARLRGAFGARATLVLESPPDGGVVAEIRIVQDAAAQSALPEAGP